MASASPVRDSAPVAAKLSGFVDHLRLNDFSVGPAETITALDALNRQGIADAGRAYDNGRPPATLPYGDGTVANPAVDRDPGTLLGEEQRAWFLDALSNSDGS